MSTKQKIQIKSKQKIKRQKRRLKLLKKGLDPKDFFFGKYYFRPLEEK
jgi:hypothetical protein